MLSAALARLESLHGWRFDPAQVELARSFVCDDRLLMAGVGPAGTGKTAAMQLTAAALDLDGCRLVAVAPWARAAAVLGAEVGVPATTIAKVLHAHDQAATSGVPVPAAWALRPGDVILVDEAGMAGTPALGRLLTLAQQSGALVRLLGDPMQLTAVEAGGALRLLAHAGPIAELDRVHRFADPAEAPATLRLRAATSPPWALRNPGSPGRRQPRGDDRRDLRRLERGPGRRQVRSDDLRVQRRGRGTVGQGSPDRVDVGAVESEGLGLHDGNQAGVGDLIVTREPASPNGLRRAGLRQERRHLGRDRASRQR